MFTAESSGTILANATPLDSAAMVVNSGRPAGLVERPQLTPVAISNSKIFFKGRQYSVKTFVSLIVLVVLLSACPEKPVDMGALITARTVGLEHLQRGRLADAEREFRKVIDLAPRDPMGYANLGLTYLRMGPGRYKDAEARLDRARKLDPNNPDVALILARLYAL